MSPRYNTNQLRNVALIAHSGAGKTSLAEAMIYDTGAISRLGRVDEGNTVSDYDTEEVRRGISINTSLVPCEWHEHKLNVLDTPGYLEFMGEVKSAIRVAEGVVVALDAVSGVEVGTELVWRFADERELPRIVFVNKMDRDNANFQRALDSLKEKFEGNIVPIQLPVGSQSDFRGVIDLIEMKAYLDPKGEASDIPDEFKDTAESLREQIIEAAAEGDDELIMKYLEGEELSDEEIRQGLALGVKNRTVIPVLCGSATLNLGIQPLLQAIIEYLPSPAEGRPEVASNPATGEEETLEADAAGPLAALVFKTVADPYVGKLTYFRVCSGTMVSDSRVLNSRTNAEERIGQLYAPRGKEQINVSEVIAGDIGAVAKLTETSTGDTLCDRDHPLELARVEYPNPLFSVAIFPETKADSAKISPTLTRICEEDPTLQWHSERSTRQTILSGMGESHIDVAVRRMKEKFGVNVRTAVPKVPYRETVTRTARAEYLHKKQTGGAGQYAKVYLRVEPLPRDEGFRYEWEVFGGAISSSFRPSIEKGIKQVMEEGVIAGYPVVDILVAVYDGKEHPVDSKDIAFQIAGREAFKKAVKEAGPVLLEPIYLLRITVPEEYMGDVLGDLNTKRAQVQGMEQTDGQSIVVALAPLAEIQRYTTDLRSMTQGRGIFTMEFSHYEQVPAHLTQAIIDQAKRRAGE